MNQQKIWTIILSILIGLLLIKYLPMAYFVGIILSFIILFGQNRQDTLNIGQPSKNSHQKVDFFPFILVGYLIAGIFSFFI